MNAVFNEQTTLLATVINNVAVSFVVVGFVTPVVAVSFGSAAGLVLRLENAVFALVWLLHRFRITSDGEADSAGHQAINADWLFITFGIPAIALTVAYAAMRADERAAKRLDRSPGE